MSRRFTLVTLVLTAIVAFLVRHHDRRSPASFGGGEPPRRASTSVPCRGVRAAWRPHRSSTSPTSSRRINPPSSTSTPRPRARAAPAALARACPIRRSCSTGRSASAVARGPRRPRSRRRSPVHHRPRRQHPDQQPRHRRAGASPSSCRTAAACTRVIAPIPTPTSRSSRSTARRACRSRRSATRRRSAWANGCAPSEISATSTT